MKKIILIAPKYYGYENYIKKEFEQKGYKVFLIYENIVVFDKLYLLISNYLKKYKKRYLERYYNRHIKSIRDDIDYVIVIRGSTVTQDIITTIKSKWPKCRMIMYQWDSVKNNSNAKDIAVYFERILTFDMNDAETYGWIYRPLFYIEELCKRRAKKIDLAFICLLHSQRVKIAKRLQDITEVSKYKSYIYIFTPFFTHLRHKYLLRDSAYDGSEDIKIKYKNLSIEETNRVYDKTRVVVDYTHPEQSGYTMRTIESIGHKCKLVTNNKEVLDADFYDKHNILVYDGNEVVIPKQFVMTPYMEVQSNIYREYALSSFVDDLLGVMRE